MPAKQAADVLHLSPSFGGCGYGADDGPEATAYVGDLRYPIELAGYRVTALDAAFSVALENITIEVG